METVRHIDRLIRAGRCAPRELPKPTNIFAKQGLRYERRVGEAIGRTCAKHSLDLELQPWFEFVDRHGLGHAVPDALISYPIYRPTGRPTGAYPAPDRQRRPEGIGNGNIDSDTIVTGFGILVIEIKLTWVPEAVDKLAGLYLPLVEAVLGLPTRAVVVCKNLTPSVWSSVTTLSAATELTASVPTLQWLGHGGIEW